ncbi:MAG: hypothetical protein JSS25_04420 [Proteobacteria bacterium]|nr:hypothetical protein [Pseudomonadota bacterium]
MKRFFLALIVLLPISVSAREYTAFECALDNGRWASLKQTSTMTTYSYGGGMGHAPDLKFSVPNATVEYYEGGINAHQRFWKLSRGSAHYVVWNTTENSNSGVKATIGSQAVSFHRCKDKAFVSTAHLPYEYPVAQGDSADAPLQESPRERNLVGEEGVTGYSLNKKGAHVSNGFYVLGGTVILLFAWILSSSSQKRRRKFHFRDGAFIEDAGEHVLVHWKDSLVGFKTLKIRKSCFRFDSSKVEDKKTVHVPATSFTTTTGTVGPYGAVIGSSKTTHYEGGSYEKTTGYTSIIDIDGMSDKRIYKEQLCAGNPANALQLEPFESGGYLMSAEKSVFRDACISIRASKEEAFRSWLKHHGVPLKYDGTEAKSRYEAEMSRILEEFRAKSGFVPGDLDVMAMDFEHPYKVVHYVRISSDASHVYVIDEDKSIDEKIGLNSSNIVILDTLFFEYDAKNQHRELLASYWRLYLGEDKYLRREGGRKLYSVFEVSDAMGLHYRNLKTLYERRGDGKIVDAYL